MIRRIPNLRNMSVSLWNDIRLVLKLVEGSCHLDFIMKDIYTVGYQ